MNINFYSHRFPIVIDKTSVGRESSCPVIWCSTIAKACRRIFAGHQLLHIITRLWYGWLYLFHNNLCRDFSYPLVETSVICLYFFLSLAFFSLRSYGKLWRVLHIHRRCVLDDGNGRHPHAVDWSKAGVCAWYGVWCAFEHTSWRDLSERNNIVLRLPQAPRPHQRCHCWWLVSHR